MICICEAGIKGLSIAVSLSIFTLILLNIMNMFQMIVYALLYFTSDNHIGWPRILVLTIPFLLFIHVMLFFLILFSSSSSSSSSFYIFLIHFLPFFTDNFYIYSWYPCLAPLFPFPAPTLIPYPSTKSFIYPYLFFS